MKEFLSKYKYQSVLILTLLVGAIFRFYDYFSIPYTWDELSALSRLKHDSFSDLIEYGVKPDGHPALVQVFLYYWTSIFGTSEWIVKLPFNLMGLASIFFFYRIGELWFDKKSGLITAVFIATVQLFVFYSSIARPYASGMFLVSVMVFYWSFYFFKGFQRKHLIGFVVFAALCAFNHHFTLLLAAIVGFSGVLFIERQKVFEYFISGLLIFLLYLPHLGIFLHQLGIGGVGGEGGYLGKPTPIFFEQFTYWLMHYSPFGILGTLLVVALSLIFGFKEKATLLGLKKRLVLSAWCLLPLLIAYFYSIEVNPVLQFSILIFSTPFLYLLISSGFSRIKFPVFLTAFIVSLSLSSYTLIFERQHFTVIFKQIYNVPMELLDEEGIATKDVLFMYSTYPEYQHFYNEKYSRKEIQSYSVLSEMTSFKQFDSLLRTSNSKYLLLSGMPENYIPFAMNYYPNLVKRENALLQESYLLSRNSNEEKEDLSDLLMESNFTKLEQGWQIDSSRIVNGSVVYNKEEEWGIKYSSNFKELTKDKKGILDLVVEFESDTLINPSIVLSIDQNQENLIWIGLPLVENSFKKGNVYKTYLSLDLRLLYAKAAILDPSITIVIWNNNFEEFKVNKIQLSQRDRNPIKYGTLYPIE